MKRPPLMTILFLCVGLVAANAQSQTVTFTNGTSQTLYELYASPSTARTWGRDLLGNGVLRSGESVTTSLKAPGRYDVMAIDEQQRQYYLVEIDLATGRRLRIDDEARYEGRSLTRPTDYSWIRIRNDTGFAVHYIYVSPAYAGSWEEGEQVLPDEHVLGTGEEYLVEFDVASYGTSVYDFLLIDEDRDRYARWNVDLEQEALLVVTLEDIQWD